MDVLRLNIENPGSIFLTKNLTRGFLMIHFISSVFIIRSHFYEICIHESKRKKSACGLPALLRGCLNSHFSSALQHSLSNSVCCQNCAVYILCCYREWHIVDCICLCCCSFCNCHDFFRFHFCDSQLF